MGERAVELRGLPVAAVALRAVIRSDRVCGVMRVGPGSDAALLERDDERRTLNWAVNQARHGNGGVVVIEGVAGVGKTSLLHLAGSLSASSGDASAQSPRVRA